MPLRAGAAELGVRPQRDWSGRAGSVPLLVRGLGLPRLVRVPVFRGPVRDPSLRWRAGAVCRANAGVWAVWVGRGRAVGGEPGHSVPRLPVPGMRRSHAATRDRAVLRSDPPGVRGATGPVYRSAVARRWWRTPSVSVHVGGRWVRGISTTSPNSATVAGGAKRGATPRSLTRRSAEWHFPKPGVP